jgi:hypothetical protein
MSATLVSEMIKSASYATLLNEKLLVRTEAPKQTLVDTGFLSVLLQPMVAAIEFDEDWYLVRHPDVAKAVRAATIESAHQHYVQSGYFEHRMPRKIDVEERSYLRNYPDVAEAIKRGAFKNAQEHFDKIGFREGRLPYPNFSL